MAKFRQSVKGRLPVITVLLSLLTLSATSAAAENWYPSKYGAEDTLGAANNLSEAGVKQAAGLVKLGRTYALGVPTGPDTPAYPPRWSRVTVLQLGASDGATLGSNQATSYDDILTTYMGVGSQIDGLGHMGINHRYYNGTPASEFASAAGLRKFSTHEIPPIVTRGVLLDMTIELGQSPLPAGTAFNRKEIDSAARRIGVQLRQGDVVLFHTGWLAIAEEDPAGFISAQPGLGVEGARYLAGLGVVAIGADTAALEAIPHEDPATAFPVHTELLAKNGVYILEVMNTTQLAADGATEFLFVLGQPRFVGAVQAIVNPVAIR
jgi:kynurenine formamidase